jgi:hypothetical protein
MEFIDYLFDKNDLRLPWHLNSIEGQVASAYVSAATARRGMKYNVLEESVQTNSSEPKFDKVVLLCQAIVASKDEEFLPAFEPDIIGETYFLVFLHDVACQNIDKDIRVSFDRMLSSGDIKQQALDVMQLVKFLKQLTDNLSNDDLPDNIIKRYWSAILKFLKVNADRFPEKHILRWVFSVALIEVYESSRKNNTGLANNCLSQVNVDDLFSLHECHQKIDRSLSEFAMQKAIQYYGYFDIPSEEMKAKLQDLARNLSNSYNE